MAASAIRVRLERHLSLVLNAHHFVGASTGQSHLIAGGSAPSLRMFGVPCGLLAVVSHHADDDRLAVPLPQELHQHALAYLRQTIETAVGGRLFATVEAAAVGGEGMQPGALARGLRVQVLPLEFHLDAALLL